MKGLCLVIYPISSCSGQTLIPLTRLERAIAIILPAGQLHALTHQQFPPSPYSSSDNAYALFWECPCLILFGSRSFDEESEFAALIVILSHKVTLVDPT